MLILFNSGCSLAQNSRISQFPRRWLMPEVFGVSLCIIWIDLAEFPRDGEEKRPCCTQPRVAACHERSEFYGAIGFNYCSGQIVMVDSREPWLLPRVFNNSKCWSRSRENTHTHTYTYTSLVNNKVNYGGWLFFRGWPLRGVRGRQSFMKRGDQRGVGCKCCRPTADFHPFHIHEGRIYIYLSAERVTRDFALTGQQRHRFW